MLIHFSHLLSNAVMATTSGAYRHYQKYHSTYIPSNHTSPATNHACWMHLVNHLPDPVVLTHPQLPQYLPLIQNASGAQTTRNCTHPSSPNATQHLYNINTIHKHQHNCKPPNHVQLYTTLQTLISPSVTHHIYRHKP